MNRRRVVFGLQVTASLVLAGLGHHTMSTLRDEYPADGWIYYAAAAIVGWLAWRTLSMAPDPVWVALRDSMRVAFGVIADAVRMIISTLRDLLPLLPPRATALVVIALNVFAALIAWLIPAATWVWQVSWAASIVMIAFAAWLRWYRQRAPRLKAMETRAAPTNVVREEVAQPIGARLNPIGLAAAIGLLIAGQAVVGSAAQDVEQTTGVIANAFRLDLPGNASLMLLGWLLTVAGVGVFAVFTRPLVMSGYAPLALAVNHEQPRRVPRKWWLVASGGAVLWLAAINSAANGATGLGGVWQWLIAGGLVALVWRQIDRLRGVRLDVTFSPIEILALTGTLLALIGVFAFRLGDVPNSVWGDEGGYFSVARDIARGAFEPNVFGPGVYGFPIAASMFQALFLKMLGESITTWRLSSVVAVAVGAIPLYLLVRATLGKRVAWLSLAAYGVMPYTLTFARMGYTLSLTLPIVTTTLALLWAALRRDSRLYAFLAGTVGGLGLMVHPSALLGLLLAALMLIGVLIVRRWPWRSIVMTSAAIMVGAAIAGGPMLTYGLTRDPDNFRGKFVESAYNSVFYARDIFPDDVAQVDTFKIGQQDLISDVGLAGTLLVRGAVRTALGFQTPALLRDGYLVGALSEPFGILMLIGLAWCLARWRRPGYAVWALWLIVGGFVLSAMSSYPPRAGLMAPVIPAMAVLGALGLAAGLDWLASVIGGVSERLKLSGLVVVVGVLALGGWRTYFSEMPDRFRPDLDNAMFWYAQTMPRNSAVVLVASSDVPDDYQPWGLHEFNLGVAFNLIRPATLASNATRVICANGCAFFYRAVDASTVGPELKAMFNTGASTPIPDADGNAQFYRFVP